VFKKLRLLSQRIRVPFSSRRISAVASAQSIGGPLLALLVVEGVGEVDPQAAIVAKSSPNLVKNIEQVPDKMIRMRLVTELSGPSIGPGSRRAVPPQEVKRRRSQASLHAVALDLPQARQRVRMQDLNTAGAVLVVRNSSSITACGSGTFMRRGYPSLGL
jgi:hypothetical protein